MSVPPGPAPVDAAKSNKNNERFSTTCGSIVLNQTDQM